jgi:CubicO group peptidase (beta-lactamase class C family)
MGAAGLRKVGSGTAVTCGDRFHLGSTTKAMTATLIGMAVEEGLLAWGSTINSVLASELPAEAQATAASITVRHLLQHQSGLPANPSASVKAAVVHTWAIQEQRRYVTHETLREPLAHAPGSACLYSNTGYIVLGCLLEHLYGCSWEELMARRLFRPLGMASAGFGAPSADGTEGNAWGHEVDGRLAAADADNPAYYGPAGTVHATLGDWAKFAWVHVRGHASNPAHKATVLLLRPETLAALHDPAPADLHAYASGWLATTRPWAKGRRARNGGLVLTHAGSNTKWKCVAWLAPELDAGVLVACNRGGEAGHKACDALAAACVKRLRG